MRRSLRRMALAGLAVLLVAAVGFSGALASNTHNKPGSSIKKEPFGSVGGTAVDIYTLTNSNGMEVKILTYGGIIQSVKVPDRRKHFENVTLGFDNLADYVAKSPYFGCITGRYANRIALGQVHARRRHLPAADQQRPEHAPRRHRRLRQAHLGGDAVPEPRRRRAQADVHEPGRRPGLPGHAQRRGHLHADGPEHRSGWTTGRTTDKADDRQPDEPRLLEPRRRGLGIDRRPRAVPQRERLHPGRPDADPDRGIDPVAGTPMDFTHATAIGDRIRDGFPQLVIGRGYDHNWVLDRRSPTDTSMIRRGAVPEPDERPRARRSSRPARDPVLLRELPRRHARRDERADVPAGRRVRARDPALPRLAEPRRTSPRPCCARGRSTSTTTIYQFSTSHH